MISMVMCVFVALSVLLNKKIRDAHPSKIIALISVGEFFTSWSMMIWQFGTVNYVCYTKSHKLYSLTVMLWMYINSWWYSFDKPNLNSKDKEWERWSLNKLELANFKCFEVFQTVGVIFNSCLCLDLYLTYKSPFYPVNRRIKLYITLAIIMAIISSFVARSFLLTDSDIYKQFIKPLLNNKIVIDEGKYILNRQTTSVKKLKLTNQEYKAIDEIKKAKIQTMERALNSHFAQSLMIISYILIAATALGFSVQSRT